MIKNLIKITERIIYTYQIIRWRQKVRISKISVLRDWLEAFFWTLLVVLIINQYLFQLYVIPSGSMEDTLKIKDRVAVNKLIYGPEIIPSYNKMNPIIPLKRGKVIIFVSPEYASHSPVYAILQRLTYMATLSLVDLDKIIITKNQNKPHILMKPFSPQTSKIWKNDLNQDNFQPQLLIKRAVGFSQDNVRFIDGNLFIKQPGNLNFTPEEKVKEMGHFNYHQKRNYNLYERNFYSGKDFFKRVSNSYFANPHSPFYRSRFYHEKLGVYVPKGYFIPFGDNRDNSHDGRWFGVINQHKILGKASFIFWPLNRIKGIK